MPAAGYERHGDRFPGRRNLFTMTRRLFVSATQQMRNSIADALTAARGDFNVVFDHISASDGSAAADTLAAALRFIYARIERTVDACAAAADALAAALFFIGASRGFVRCGRFIS
jgi:hypothetical protein